MAREFDLSNLPEDGQHLDGFLVLGEFVYVSTSAHDVIYEVTNNFTAAQTNLIPDSLNSLQSKHLDGDLGE